MNPLYFGASERQLFGVYRPPGRQPGRNRGVVLCNPFGDEAIKAHRAYRLLATRLAQERFHVLRFDYYGTGDSGGGDEQGTMAQWLADIGAAVDELKDASGAAKVSLAGLRLGAALALLAGDARRDVDRVALWDPILRGDEYLRELARCHDSYMRRELRNWRRPMVSAGGDHEVMGFPVSRALRRELEAIDLRSFEPRQLKQVALVTSARSDGGGESMVSWRRTWRRVAWRSGTRTRPRDQLELRRRDERVLGAHRGDRRDRRGSLRVTRREVMRRRRPRW